MQYIIFFLSGIRINTHGAQNASHPQVDAKNGCQNSKMQPKPTEWSWTVRQQPFFGSIWTKRELLFSPARWIEKAHYVDLKNHHMSNWTYTRKGPAADVELNYQMSNINWCFFAGFWEWEFMFCNYIKVLNMCTAPQEMLLLHMSKLFSFYLTIKKHQKGLFKFF